MLSGETGTIIHHFNLYSIGIISFILKFITYRLYILIKIVILTKKKYTYVRERERESHDHHKECNIYGHPIKPFARLVLEFHGFQAGFDFVYMFISSTI